MKAQKKRFKAGRGGRLAPSAGENPGPGQSGNRRKGGETAPGARAAAGADSPPPSDRAAPGSSTAPSRSKVGRGKENAQAEAASLGAQDVGARPERAKRAEQGLPGRETTEAERRRLKLLRRNLKAAPESQRSAAAQRRIDRAIKTAEPVAFIRNDDELFDDRFRMYAYFRLKDGAAEDRAPGKGKKRKGSKARQAWKERKVRAIGRSPIALDAWAAADGRKIKKKIKAATQKDPKGTGKGEGKGEGKGKGRDKNFGVVAIGSSAQGRFGGQPRAGALGPLPAWDAPKRETGRLSEPAPGKKARNKMRERLERKLAKSGLAQQAKKSLAGAGKKKGKGRKTARHDLYKDADKLYGDWRELSRFLDLLAELRENFGVKPKKLEKLLGLKRASSRGKSKKTEKKDGARRTRKKGRGQKRSAGRR